MAGRSAHGQSATKPTSALSHSILFHLPFPIPVLPHPRLASLTLALFLPLAAASAASSITYPAAPGGPGAGKHLVFLTGDEEYRGEDGLPMLAKILSQRHGFRCTALFPLDPDGTINPDNNKSLADADALDRADGLVLALRFRQ